MLKNDYLLVCKSLQNIFPYKESFVQQKVSVYDLLKALYLTFQPDKEPFIFKNVYHGTSFFVCLYLLITYIYFSIKSLHLI